MEMKKVQEEADTQRNEAKQILRDLLGIKREGLACDSNGMREGRIDRMVDCIISAAILEAVINQGIKLKPDA